ncbi:MAG: SurA N-terminal domain-containing protein [Chloracidobacterium sp.]|nr:SurA N-terminal domain-containing protein [Chloracidobacterium sp.]
MRNKRPSLTAAIALSAAFFAACGQTPPGKSQSGSVDPNETAAKVNGKVITMQDVERAVKQESRGQEAKMSPLELAAARLQILQNLVEQEVMYQKAEAEKLVPTEEDITAEINKRKVESRMSAEEFDKQMKEAGLDEKSFRETVRKGLAIQKLIDKITGRIETPSEREIEEFFKSNPDMFVKKRGVRLAAIVIDPSDNGQGDTTRNAAEAEQKVKEVLTKVAQPASDFAAIAREYSEDGSRLQGGDLGYISEQELKQNFGDQIAGGFMNPQFDVGRITNAVPLQGKAYIFKLQERIEKDESLTLENPAVRPQITQLLTDNRKQLLAASYQTIAMNEAKIENFLAKKVVDNPNELSGARPAAAANSNTAANSNSNAAPSNINSAANTNEPNGNSKSVSNDAANKPAANAPTK